MEIPYIHDELIHNENAARKVLTLILQKFKINSILDVGTGIGTWLKVANESGINDFIGIDGNWVDFNKFKIPLSNFKVVDLNKEFDLERKFDLLICLEVAEHLKEYSSSVLIDSLTKHSDFILFSAAIPMQGGQNHYNEQFPQYWIRLFEKKGYKCYDYLRPYFWNDSNIEWWYRQNMFLFSKNVIKPLVTEDSFNNSYIHPELYNKIANSNYNKGQQLEIIKRDLSELINGNKTIYFYIKLLIKALLIRISRYNFLRSSKIKLF